MPIERTQPQGLVDNPRFTHVIKTGNLIFIAGQTPLNASG